jgi:hypothetical protein
MVFYLNGQKLYYSPYQKKMDSISMTKLNLNLKQINTKKNVYTYKPYKWVKLTFKTRLNNNVINKIRLDNGVLNMFNYLDMEDYLSLGVYDVRMKLYLSKTVSFIQTIVINGVQNKTYGYTTGLIIKI